MHNPIEGAIISGEETNNLQELAVLRVIVHPLFQYLPMCDFVGDIDGYTSDAVGHLRQTAEKYGVIVPDNIIVGFPTNEMARNTFAVARSKLALAILRKFQPQQSDELTLFMPNIDVTDNGDWDRDSWIINSDILARIAFMDESALDWRRLYRTMKHDDSAPYRENVLLTKNIVGQKGFSELNIQEGLSRMGWKITPSTRIILAGEWLEACETAAALLMLQLPEITSIALDKGASLSSEYYEGSDVAHLSWEIFLHAVAASGFSLSENESYITISRPPLAAK